MRPFAETAGSTAPALDGVLNVNKPAGMTSHDVVDRIRRVIRNRKIRVGHTGTLDPMATGVLPLCVGKATKISQFLIAVDKEYLVEMKLGIVTDTQDVTGKTIEEPPVPENLDSGSVEAVLAGFRGEIQQVPPMISAKHHQGKRLYELARRGVEVEREPCLIVIHQLLLEDISPPVIRFRVVCGKGTYIRTLCHDIGRALGSGAAMSGLVRVRCGHFHVDRSVPLDRVRSREDIAENLSGLSEALGSMPLIQVGPEGKASLMCGRNLTGGVIRRRDGEFKPGDLVRIVERGGNLLGVGKTLMGSDEITPLAGNLGVVRPVKTVQP